MHNIAVAEYHPEVNAVAEWRLASFKDGESGEDWRKAEELFLFLADLNYPVYWYCIAEWSRDPVCYFMGMSSAYRAEYKKISD